MALVTKVAPRTSDGLPAPRSATDLHGINFSWLVRLRWGATLGQVLTIAAVGRAMGVDLPLAPLSVIVALEVATNVACVVWSRTGRPVGDVLVASVLGLDVVLLTGLLYFTGGPFNPFSSFTSSRSRSPR